MLFLTESLDTHCKFGGVLLRIVNACHCKDWERLCRKAWVKQHLGISEPSLDRLVFERGVIGWKIFMEVNCGLDRILKSASLKPMNAGLLESSVTKSELPLHKSFGYFQLDQRAFWSKWRPGFTRGLRLEDLFGTQAFATALPAALRGVAIPHTKPPFLEKLVHLYYRNLPLA